MMRASVMYVLGGFRLGERSLMKKANCLTVFLVLLSAFWHCRCPSAPKQSWIWVAARDAFTEALAVRFDAEPIGIDPKTRIDTAQIHQDR